MRTRAPDTSGTTATIESPARGSRSFRPLPATPAKTVRAVIYLRISSDPTNTEDGVTRQRTDCQALADRLGYEVLEVYRDNDISAYSGKPRPEYDRMIEAVEAGTVDAIVAWHPDRLYRRAVELERFVAVAEKHDLHIRTVTAGDVDLTTPTGRMNARIIAAVAQHEVEHAKGRMRAAKRQRAEKGLYRGGQRPYGFEKDGHTVRETEAVVIRRAMADALAGRSLKAISRELNERGHRTARGRSWTPTRVREMLIKPRNAGLIHTGRPERGAEGETFEIVGRAQWDAIVSEDDWRSFHRLVTDSSRRTNDTNSEPRWLGSWIYTCGLCGAPMRAQGRSNSTANARDSYKVYRCSETGHLSIHAVHTDNHIRTVVRDLIHDPRVVAAMLPADDRTEADRDRREALTRRLETFEADYTAGRVTGSQLEKATRTVTAELAEINDRLSLAMRTSAAAPVIGAPDPGSAFMEAPLDVQRAVLRMTLRVEVLPTAVRGHKWTPQRLRITPVTRHEEQQSP